MDRSDVMVTLAGYHFFENLYNTVGFVPAGKNAVHLYWEGMHVSTTEFQAEE